VDPGALDAEHHAEVDRGPLGGRGPAVGADRVEVAQRADLVWEEGRRVGGVAVVPAEHLVVREPGGDGGLVVVVVGVPGRRGVG